MLKKISLLFVLGLFILAPFACERDSGSDPEGGDGDGDADNEPDEPEAGQVGAPCTRNADCNSSFCLSGGRCTRECDVDGDCPDTWECGAIEGAGALCICNVTGDEVCDGVDNDCNGLVDERVSCGDGLVCRDGGCTCPIESSCDGVCVDFETDATNCGACGNTCEADQACVDGTCVLDCGDGMAECGGECVNVATDTSNCGSCGNECPSDNFCVGGSCELDCPMPNTICGSRCVDTETDEAHCGACDRACGSGELCLEGECLCDGDTTRCDGACVDLNDDDENCGACGNVCDADEECAEGECLVACGGGTTRCDGECVNLNSDDENCGTCGRACGEGSSCEGGTCERIPVTGAPCTSDADCGARGYCITETGWDGGFCTYFDCPSPACPTDGFCATDGSGGTFCLSSCAGLDDCREGYVCLYDWSTESGYCYPDCANAPATFCGPWACGSDGLCEDFCDTWSDPTGCSDGSTCRYGYCECTAATDCGAGRSCNEDTGYCE